MEISEDEFLLMQKKCDVYDDLSKQSNSLLTSGNIRITSFELHSEREQVQLNTYQDIQRYASGRYRSTATIEILICQ